MAWKRGNSSVEVELSNVQSKIESWSEQLDGEEGFMESTKRYINEQRGMWKLILGLGVILTLLLTILTIHSFFPSTTPTTTQHSILE